MSNAQENQLKLSTDLDVRAFGAKGNGTTDDTAAIQAAATYAIANGYAEVRLPAGTYLVSATINLGRLSLVGEGDGSRIKPSISDGSAVLSIATATNFFTLRSFRIDSELSLANFLSGAINAQNCIGIKVISTGGTYSARYVMRDVLVRGCKVGYDINGFIGTLDNVFAQACEQGLIGTTFNSTRAHLRFEECRQDFVLTACAGVHFDQYISEGGALASGLLASTVDGVSGFTMTAPYFEHTRNVPFIRFGATTLCKSVTIDGLTVANGDAVGKDNEIYMLAFDKVDGLSIAGRFATGTAGNRYSTTTSTKNLLDLTTSEIDQYYVTDASKNLGPARNLFPNPNFDLWLRGYPGVAAVRGTIAQETTLVRRGSNALKFTATAGQANGYASFTFNDSQLNVTLRGKTVTVYAWVWIPNLTEFNPNPRPPAAVVCVGITTTGTGGATSRSSDTAGVRGAWNLISATATIPADCTDFSINLYIIRNSGTTTGNEYLVADSVYLIEGDGGQTLAVKNGWITDSELNPCQNAGGRMVLRADSAPTDVDQTYAVGDQVWKLTAVAAASPGWVCTTGGAGGTAVFKAMANLAA